MSCLARDFSAAWLRYFWNEPEHAPSTELFRLTPESAIPIKIMVRKVLPVVRTVTCKIGFGHFAQKSSEHRPHLPFLALTPFVRVCHPSTEYGVQYLRSSFVPHIYIISLPVNVPTFPLYTKKCPKQDDYSLLIGWNTSLILAHPGLGHLQAWRCILAFLSTIPDSLARLRATNMSTIYMRELLPLSNIPSLYS